MEITIAYDNESEPGFQSGWGFSTLIRMEDRNLLFDTGEDGDALVSNLNKFGIRARNIDDIFISHEHWDHINGLDGLRGIDARVYALRSFSTRFKNDIKSHFDLIEVSGPQKIGDRLWTTGGLGKTVKEQSLVVETCEGLLVVTGCSHPGVRKILDNASQFGDLYGLLGGLHDFRDYECLKDLSFLAPMHCTSHKREIFEEYPEASRGLHAGLEIEFCSGRRGDVCKWYSVCPMKRFYEQGKLEERWINEYCKGDYEECVRYQMEKRGEPHPDNMLPNGEIRENLK